MPVTFDYNVHFYTSGRSTLGKEGCQFQVKQITLLEDMGPEIPLGSIFL